MTFKTVKWVILQLDSCPQYIESFNKTLCTDEIFFHSLLKTKESLNIYHDVSKVNDCLRYIDWKSGPEYPRLLNGNDINLIKKSNAFFCRKVDNKMSDSEFSIFKNLVEN